MWTLFGFSFLLLYMFSVMATTKMETSDGRSPRDYGHAGKPDKNHGMSHILKYLMIKPDLLLTDDFLEKTLEMYVKNH